MSKIVHVVRTGTANLASVLVALKRVGAEPHVTHDPAEVAQAERLLVPGVGTFGASMEALRKHGLEQPLLERVQEGRRATLGICVGLQLFCQSSAESPGALGMGAVHGVLRRFGTHVRVPQLGWNEVRPQGGTQLVTSGYAYFAHSYRLEEVPAGWHGSTTDHGGVFVSALERGPMLLCQFHPELSGAYGLALLGRWMEAA